jgi:hypothetical protein
MSIYEIWKRFILIDKNIKLVERVFGLNLINVVLSRSSSTDLNENKSPSSLIKWILLSTRTIW